MARRGGAGRRPTRAPVWGGTIRPWPTYSEWWMRPVVAQNTRSPGRRPGPDGAADHVREARQDSPARRRQDQPDSRTRRGLPTWPGEPRGVGGPRWPLLGPDLGRDLGPGRGQHGLAGGQQPPDGRLLAGQALPQGQRLGLGRAQLGHPGPDGPGGQPDAGQRLEVTVQHHAGRAGGHGQLVDVPAASSSSRQGNHSLPSDQSSQSLGRWAATAHLGQGLHLTSSRALTTPACNPATPGRPGGEPRPAARGPPGTVHARLSTRADPILTGGSAYP